MKKFAIFALFLFVGTSCHEATIEKCHCFVTISDALPIQFWPTGCASYNTANKCGVHNACWCAPVECDDPVPLVFVDESPSQHIAFGENIIIADSENIAQDIDLPAFDLWDQSLSAYAWTLTSTTAELSLPSGDDGNIFVALTGFKKGRYSFIYDIEVSAGAATVSFNINIYKGGVLVGATSISPELTTGQFIGTIVTNVVDDPDKIEIIFTNNGGSSKTMLINSLVLSAESVEYRHTFLITPSALETPICNEQSQMLLHSNVLNPNFNNWQSIDYISGTTNWGVTFNEPNAVVIFGNSGTDWFVDSKSYNTGDVVRFVGTFRITNAANTYAFRIGGLDDSDNEIFSIDPIGSGTIAGDATYTFDYEYTINAPVTKVGFRINQAPPGGSSGVMTVIRFISTGEVAYTDCLDVKTDQGCTTLIEYSNARNFAGIIYEDESPDQTFQIRIPSVFFHERFPEEDEDIELPSSLLSLNSSLKAQRLLDTAYMPYYMHRKLMLVLKHQFITIDGTEYIKEEPYEIQEGDRRWPLKKAKCYLSEKNYVQRNVL